MTSSTDIAAELVATAPTPERLAGHRMAAVASVMFHGIQHHLPEPSTITPDEDMVRMSLRTHTFGVWAASLILDNEPTSRVGSPELLSLLGPCQHWTATGRLPDTGVRLQISGHMLASTDEVA